MPIHQYCKRTEFFVPKLAKTITWYNDGNFTVQPKVLIGVERLAKYAQLSNFAKTLMFCGLWQYTAIIILILDLSIATQVAKMHNISFIGCCLLQMLKPPVNYSRPLTIFLYISACVFIIVGFYIFGDDFVYSLMNSVGIIK